MFGYQDFLLGGLAPLFVAALAVIVAFRMGSRPATGWTIGVIAGYAAGLAALRARDIGLGAALVRLVAPHEALEWTPHLSALAAMPWCVAVALRGRRGGAALAGLLALAATIIAVLRLLWGGKYLPTAEVRASGFAPQAWSGWQAAFILGAIAVGVLSVAGMWLRQERNEQPRWRALLLVIVTVAAAMTAALTGSFSLGQACGCLAAALTGAAAGAWLMGVEVGPEAATGPILLILASLLVLAVGYSEMRLWQALLLALAAAAAVGRIPWCANWSAKARTSLRAALVAIPVTVAVGVAGREFAASQQKLEEERAANPYLQYQQK